jgi:hypothetical protein
VGTDVAQPEPDPSGRELIRRDGEEAANRRRCQGARGSQDRQPRQNGRQSQQIPAKRVLTLLLKTPDRIGWLRFVEIKHPTLRYAE